VVILWDLGTKSADDDESVFNSVSVVTFDTDASIQAQIWQLFVRKRRNTGMSANTQKPPVADSTLNSDDQQLPWMSKARDDGELLSNER
jgi:hypothetical protein